MQPAGWLFMILSWGVILGVFVYSLWRTLSSANTKDDGDDAGKPS